MWWAYVRCVRSPVVLLCCSEPDSIRGSPVCVVMGVCPVIRVRVRVRVRSCGGRMSGVCGLLLCVVWVKIQEQP